MIQQTDALRRRRRREAKDIARTMYPGMHAIITAEGCIPIAQYDVPIWTVTFWDYTMTPTGVIERVNVDSVNVYFGGEHEQDYRIVPKVGEK